MEYYEGGMPTENELRDTILRGHKLAGEAAIEYFEKELKGVDSDRNGYAWVEITAFKGKGIKADGELGQILKSCNVGCNCHRRFGVWNPGNFICNDMGTLEYASNVFAKELEKIGFTVIVCTKRD